MRVPHEFPVIPTVPGTLFLDTKASLPWNLKTIDGIDTSHTEATLHAEKISEISPRVSGLSGSAKQAPILTASRTC